MANVGSAYVTLMPSMKGFASEIGKEFGSAGKSAGNAFGSGISSGVEGGSSKAKSALSALGSAASTVAKVGVAAFAAVTTGVAAIGSAALTSYADYEQLVGGVNKLFGDASGKLQQYAANAYATSGMSANQYMEQATSFSASLIQSLGGDTSAAADMANVAMQAMSDNVNVFGSNMEDVQNAFQGFAKQNYTMLDNLKLGYGGTQSEMQRLISDANEYAASIGQASDLSIDSFADIVQAIELIQEKQGIAGTTINEAASTISGSIGMAKAAWENFVTGLGRDDADFSALTQNLLDSIGAVANNVAPRVATIGANIIAAFPGALSGLASILAPVVSEALANAWNIAAAALSSVGLQLPTVDASQIMAAFQQLADFATGTLAPAFQPVMDALGNLVSTVGPLLLPLITQIGTLLAGAAPIIGQVVAAVVNVATQIMAVVMPILTDILTWVNANMPLIQSVVTSVMTDIQQDISAALTVIQTVWNAVWPAIQAVLTAVMAVIAAVVSGDMSGIQSVIDTAMSVVASVISSVLSAISGKWNSIWGSIRGAFSSIWRGIQGAASAGIDAVYSTVTGIKNRIVGFFSGAGSWLVNAGTSILNGLKSGIMSAIGSVTSAVSSAVQSIRDLFPFSPAKEGPFSGHGYTTYSGKALMGDFADSIRAQTGKVVKATGTVLAAAQGGLTASLAVSQPVAVQATPQASTREVTMNFYGKTDSPDEVARMMRLNERYGFAGSY